MPGPRRDFGPKQKVENPVKVFKRIMSYVLKRYPVHCLFVLICIVVSVYANVQGTMFMKTLIDGYITPLLGQANPDYSELLQAIIKMGILYVIGIAATFGNTKIMVYVTQGTMRNIRNDMFKHMESLPIKYFDTHKHGDIMSMYTNDVDTLRQMVSQSIPQFINSLISIVNVLIYMIILSVPLTLVSIVMVMLVIWASKTAASRSGKFFVSQQKNIGALNGFIEEMMDGQKVVKVFCHEEESIERFDQLNNDLFGSAYNANRYANILGPINAQLGNLSYVVVAIVGGLVAINGIGGFTLGSLASFLTLNKSFQQPINQISNQLNSIVMALAGGDRIFRLLDEKPEVDDGYVTLTDAVVNADGTITESNKRTGTWAWKHYHKAEGTTDYRQLKGDVVFEHVDFGYNDDKMVLHDVSLYAQPGQKIAFVGSTGAGKTTITNLINRFYDIQSGKIRYDGINIGKIKFPAPKNIPNNILATNINSLNVRFFFMFHLPYTSEYYKYFSHYIYFVPMRQTPLLYIFYQEYIQCIIYTSDSPVLFKLSLIFLNIPAIPTIFLFSMIYLFYTFNETQTLRRTCFFTTPNSLLKHI